MKLIAIAAVLTLFASSAALACGPEQFKVSGMNMRVESSYFIITGEVTNNCTEAAAIWLQATTYSKDGTVLDTEQFMPSSTSNISAGSALPFKTMLHLDETIVRYSVVPVRVEKW
jgi:hypothetical protein